MTMNAKMGRFSPGPSQEVIGGDAQTDAIVTPVARPVPVSTSGRMEFVARCPVCRSWHRHVGLGEKTGPCGTTYRLEFKAKLKGAA